MPRVRRPLAEPPHAAKPLDPTLADDGLGRPIAYAEYVKAGYESRIISQPTVVAAAIAKVVKARKPKTRYAVDGGAGMLLFMKFVLNDRSFDYLSSMSMRRVAL